MRFALLAVLLVLLTVPADAQRRRHAPFAEKGDVALFASIQGLADVRLSPALGGIGVRYRLGDQTVLGTSVGFSLRDSDSETTDDPQTRERDESTGTATASMWVEQHVGGRHRTISPFVGAGLRVRATEVDRDDTNVVFPCGDPEACEPAEVSSTNEVSTRGIGGAVFLGAEVRIVRGVTLGGAYGIGAEYYRTEYRQSQQVPDMDRFQRSEQEGVQAGTGLGSFFLSVYF